MSYLINHKCPQCNRIFSPHNEQTFCRNCNSPILAQYDLVAAKKHLDRDQLGQRKSGMWRWHELLPIEDLYYVSSLGEGDTPLLPLVNLGNRYNAPNIFAKDESVNPTASFKARGLSAAVSKAHEIGLENLVIPTAGNAGGALAAYSSRIRMKSLAVMPADTPIAMINECRLYGAEVILVDGFISDCTSIVEEMTSSGEWFSVSTFREPYRLEGKKTMGYELAEQCCWRLPNTIIYPTGGGTGLIGLWKAFQEFKALGWIEDFKFPKMISVQSDGCAPIVKAFNTGEDKCEFWQGATTIAAGLRVPLSMADTLILDILRESRGTAVAVADEDMLAAQIELGKFEGLFASPEGAATLAAFIKLRADGFIQPEETIVLFITASGVKYI